MDYIVLVKLLLSVFLAGIVGWQREKTKTPAGLRTHMLVALGATVFTIISSELGVINTVDPTRITAGIVTGIGFLGAGTIIHQSDSVRGLSTAASIWTIAAVGMSVGYGMYELAIMGAVLTLLILMLEGVEKKLIK